MPLNFYATFTNGTNNGVTGLVPLISVTRIALSSGTQSALFTAATMSAVTNCSGGYFYNMTASADLTSFDYFASIVTNSTVSVDTPYAASLWSEFGVQASVSIDNATQTRNTNLLLLNSSTPTYNISGTNMLLNVASVINTGTSTGNVNVTQINGSAGAAASLALFGTASINSTTHLINTDVLRVNTVATAAQGLYDLSQDYYAFNWVRSNIVAYNASAPSFTYFGTATYLQTDMILDAGATQSAGDIVSLLNALSGFTFGGAYTRSFHVQDTQTNSLQSATVRIQLNSQAEYHVTPASGNFTTSLDAHTYGINATCPGYQGYSNSLTVSGDGSFTIVMTPVSISPPANPDATRVYFFLYNAAQTVMVGSTVTWQINTPPYNTGQQPPASVSDVNGMVYADVPRGITLQPTTPLGLQKEFTVPADAGATLEYIP